MKKRKPTRKAAATPGATPEKNASSYVCRTERVRRYSGQALCIFGIPKEVTDALGQRRTAALLKAIEAMGLRLTAQDSLVVVNLSAHVHAKVF